jgi:Ca-activated chloride channel family protein
MLLLLLLIPPAVYARHFWKGRGGKLLFPFGTWGGTGFSPPRSLMLAAYRAGIVAFWVGVGLLIVALSGPVRVTREQVFITRGVDIMIALDQSPTMAAQDFRPENRFEAAKQVIEDFIERRTNDPIGIVGFGAEASLRVPPTLDYEHVRQVLEAMRILELGDGTAIGMGLAVAALHLSDSTAPRRVIILLTDGVNNAGEILPETAARAAASLGIQVYVVGIGSGEEVDIEVEDPSTGRVQRGTIRDGFDEGALRSIAEAGDGTYFYAGSNGALAGVFSAIDTVERTEQRSLLRIEREPRYAILVLVALCCILLDFLIRRLLAGELL